MANWVCGGKDSNLPLPVGGLNRVSSMAAGEHALALKADGTVWGWGNNHFGQVGGTGDPILQPVRVSGL
jgi:alpha-tubulin suppressor-like RCC1 family protein